MNSRDRPCKVPWLQFAILDRRKFAGDAGYTSLAIRGLQSRRFFERDSAKTVQMVVNPISIRTAATWLLIGNSKLNRVVKSCFVKVVFICGSDFDDARLETEVPDIVTQLCRQFIRKMEFLEVFRLKIVPCSLQF